jgi:membrane-associated protease RseP (regulator of RpoE activity)
MNQIPSSIVLLIALLGAIAPAFAQAPQPPSSYYPAPPPEQAPTVQQGAPLSGLSSPLPASAPKIDRTEIASFADARRIVWGRYAKVKGAKPGDVAVTRQGNLWAVKGRIDSVAPGSEGDWASIDGVVERISAGHVQIRGEVAFRVAKVEKGIPCKVAGVLNFRRSGKSQVWRLAEGDNPCDGTRENFDLVYEKSAEKKPVPAQPKRG